MSKKSKRSKAQWRPHGFRALNAEGRSRVRAQKEAFLRKRFERGASKHPPTFGWPEVHVLPYRVLVDCLKAVHRTEMDIKVCEKHIREMELAMALSLRRAG